MATEHAAGPSAQVLGRLLVIQQAIDALEVRPAHDPTREYGFLGVVVDTTNLEGSIWTWYREHGRFHIRKTATIPAEPADADQLPALLKGFGAVPPLISDIDLSLDDRFLYVACRGTGELRQYDVTDPMHPVLTGSVRVGGIARRAAHPSGHAYGGGPQMTEISRNGKRVYFTNSHYSSWDAQFYPSGVSAGHFMANAVALLPFAVLGWYVEWSRAIRLGAGSLVLLFGVFKLVNRRHPRMLARLAPTRLAWWSFVMATAHGAGLMLAPLMLGLCAAPASGAPAGAGHAAVMAFLARASMGAALLVAAVHALAALLAGLCMAWMVYRWLGLGYLRRAWFKLDVVWRASLVLAGAAGIGLAIWS